MTDTPRPLRFPTSCGRPGFCCLRCTSRLRLQSPVCTLPAWSFNRHPQGSHCVSPSTWQVSGCSESTDGREGSTEDATIRSTSNLLPQCPPLSSITHTQLLRKGQYKLTPPPTSPYTQGAACIPNHYSPALQSSLTPTCLLRKIEAPITWLPPCQLLLSVACSLSLEDVWMSCTFLLL